MPYCRLKTAFLTRIFKLKCVFPKNSAENHIFVTLLIFLAFFFTQVKQFQEWYDITKMKGKPTKKRMCLISSAAFLFLAASGCMTVSDLERMTSEDATGTDTQVSVNDEQNSELQTISLECRGPAITTVYTAEDDRIVKIVQDIFMSDEEVSLQKGHDRGEAAKAIQKSAEKLHKSLNGIQVKVKDTGKGFNVITSYDLNIASLKDLTEEGLLQGSDEQDQYVSFSKTRSRLNDRACPEGLRIGKE